MAISARSSGKLSEYIRRTLQVERFGEPFSTLLVETFARMQYVLELSPSELQEDISNFATSTWQFRFDHLPKNTMGWSDPNNHEIVFNIDYWQNLMNRYPEEVYTVKFFETFVHECLHGMQEKVDNYGRLYNRAGGYNQKTGNRAHAIYEICTQATAAKMARNRKYNDFKAGEILAGDGYSDEIFAVPLIASTFGVSEQEVLKYGLRERDKLVEALNKHIGNIGYTADMLSKIEDELEMIHSIGYPDDNQANFKNMPDSQKRKLKTDSILKLTKLCQGVFSTRIQNTPLDVDNKTITAYKFDQKKMLDTLRNEFFYYGNGLDRSYNQMFLMTTEFGEEASYIKNSLNILSDVAKDTLGRYSHNKAQIVDCIRRNDFDSLDRFGLNYEREVTMYLAEHDIGMRERKLHRDYNSLVDWDNKVIQDTIYRRIIDTDKIPVSLNLKEWDENRLNSYDGARKLFVLQKAARLTAQKHDGKDIRYVLFDYINSTSSELPNIYQKITRNYGARDEFTQEFNKDSDKEFLVKMMAKKYLEKIYDFDSHQAKNNADESKLEYEIRINLLPTLEKYGKEHTMWAISKSILEGNYDSISNGTTKARENLELVSPKSFLDVVSKPLMDDLMQKREIPKNIKDSVNYGIYRTEEKYPGTIASRIASFVEDFNKYGAFNYNHFTTNGRSGLMQNIRSRDDLEAMIGYICNNFSEKAESEQDIRGGNNNVYTYYKDIAIQMGSDSFREAMIQAIIDQDFSQFPAQYASYFGTIDTRTILTSISGPTIEKTMQMAQILNRNGQMPSGIPVTVGDLKNNAEKQKLSLIDKFLDKLKSVFGKNTKRNYTQGEILDEGR